MGGSRAAWQIRRCNVTFTRGIDVQRAAAILQDQRGTGPPRGPRIFMSPSPSLYTLRWLASDVGTFSFTIAALTAGSHRDWETSWSTRQR